MIADNKLLKLEAGNWWIIANTSGFAAFVLFVCSEYYEMKYKVVEHK